MTILRKTDPLVAYIVAWISFSVFLILRVTLVRDIGEPYAEDGSALILGALSAPWNVVKPVVDGIFILPRFYATISTAISLTKAPAILAFLSAGTVSFIALFGLQRAFSSIVAQFWPKLFISLLIVANIGTREVASSAMCVSYGFTLLLLFIALERPLRSTQYLIPLVFILSFSTNSSFVAAPLFYLSWLKQRNKASLAAAAITCLPIPIMLFLSTLTKSPHTVARIVDLSTVFASLLGHVLFNLFCLPLAGGFLADRNQIFQLSALFLSYAAFRKLWQWSQPEARILSRTLLGSGVLYLLAHQLGRPYSISGSVLDFRIGSGRAEFLLIPLVVLGWSALIFSSNKLSNFKKNFIFCWIIAIQLLTTVSYLGLAFPEVGTKSWERFATELTSARESAREAPIKDILIGPYFAPNVPWGLIHCDSSDPVFIKCEDLHGNREGVVHAISRYSKDITHTE